MANRHLSRSIVLQTLFEWDLNDMDKKGVQEVLERNVTEFSQNKTDAPFIEKLLNGVISKRPELDQVIEKAAPEWPIDRISPVDRNILRLGLFELLFADRKEVPAKVAINEAIELAKQFGGENSSRFVNGVLGAVYKEIGEPGKDEVGKRPRKKCSIRANARAALSWCSCLCAARWRDLPRTSTRYLRALDVV
jgi:transcription antitermination protein NusB